MRFAGDTGSRKSGVPKNLFTFTVGLRMNFVVCWMDEGLRYFVTSSEWHPWIFGTNLTPWKRRITAASWKRRLTGCFMESPEGRHTGHSGPVFYVRDPPEFWQRDRLVQQKKCFPPSVNKKGLKILSACFATLTYYNLQLLRFLARHVWTNRKSRDNTWEIVSINLWEKWDTKSEFRKINQTWKWM